jgi:hypothetical protein
MKIQVQSAVRFNRNTDLQSVRPAELHSAETLEKRIKYPLAAQAESLCSIERIALGGREC